MNNMDKERLASLLHAAHIPSGDIPDIELYMDQITTFMDARLDSSKRYPDDKIITKTMVNNYTKNHLLPPSTKKKYSREHVFLLILIYHLKNMLSIADIQTLLEPLSEKYFPAHAESGLTLREIYDKTVSQAQAHHEEIEEDILKAWDSSRGSYEDRNLPDDEAAYLDDFTFICRLCYDIYVRKQMIERIIDQHRASAGKKRKKNRKEV